MPAVDQTKHTVQDLPTYIIKIPMCIFEPVIPLPINSFQIQIKLVDSS